MKVLLPCNPLILIIVISTSFKNASAIIGGMRAQYFSAAKSTVLIDNGIEADPRFCSGVVITRIYILTVGSHCCGSTPNGCEVLVGSEKSFKGGESIRTTTTQVIGIHENFPMVILQLQRTIALDNYYPIILLASDADKNEDEEGRTIFGWGDTVINSKDTLSDFLMMATDVPELDMEVCRKGYYKDLFTEGELELDFKCCGFVSHSPLKATLFDQGGPLINLNLGIFYGLILTDNKVFRAINESEPYPILVLDVSKPKNINKIWQTIRNLEGI